MSIVCFQTVWIRLSHKCFFTFLIRIQNMCRQFASSQILELRVLDNRQVSFPCIHVLSLPFPSKRLPFQVIPLAFPSMGTPTSCRTPPYDSLLHTITGAPCLFLPATVSLDNNGENDLQGEGDSHWPLATGLKITDPTLPCSGEEMLFGCRPSSLYFPQSLY